MNQSRASTRRAARVALPLVLLALLLASVLPADVLAQTPAPAAAAAPAPTHGGGEANIRIPDLSQSQFLGVNGRSLLTAGLGVCVLGLIFGLVIYSQLKNLPVHQSMREISELIYETCKTYLITQGKFILILEAFIGVIIVLYFGVLLHFEASKVDHHPALQPHRHRGQLRRGLVRHPDQHLRELAHGLREPRGEALSRSTRSPSRRA